MAGDHGFSGSDLNAVKHEESVFGIATVALSIHRSPRPASVRGGDRSIGVRNWVFERRLAGGSRVSARARDPQSDLQLRRQSAFMISDQELRPLFR